MSTTLKGVNLGGWLVIERWMTPSLFKGTSATNEFELSASKQGRERIAKHHQTFITMDDLVWLKKSGIEIIRVPVGYWIFGQDKRYVGAIAWLDWLMDASLSLGLKVLLDLHAAPGAQNRAAHSGSGNVVSSKHSTKWLNDKPKQAETIEILCKLAERYHRFPNVWGLELLNEPTVDLLGLRLARFYRLAYGAVTKLARPGTRVVFSDGYAPLRLTNCLRLIARPEYPVVMDVHIYRVFGSHNKRKHHARHMNGLKWTKLFLHVLRLQQPLIVGEWSAMLPHRTSADQTREYAKGQLWAFRPSSAQFYWNYKTEADGRWNFRDQLEKELIQYS
jgi:glucan 1,3-beta-glucosidase